MKNKQTFYSSYTQEPTDTSKRQIRTRYLGHMTGYQPIRYHVCCLLSVKFVVFTIRCRNQRVYIIRPHLLFAFMEFRFGTRYLGHVTGYQPIRDHYFLIVILSKLLYYYNISTYLATKHVSYKITRYLGHVTADWLSANQGPVFPDSVGTTGSGAAKTAGSAGAGAKMAGSAWANMAGSAGAAAGASSMKSEMFEMLEKGEAGEGTDQNKSTTNPNSLFRSRDWLSANDSVGSWLPHPLWSEVGTPPLIISKLSDPRTSPILSCSLAMKSAAGSSSKNAIVCCVCYAEEFGLIYVGYNNNMGVFLRKGFGFVSFGSVSRPGAMLSSSSCAVVEGTTMTPSTSVRITRYLGHVTGYQPIMDQYFLIRSVPATRTI
eukprot:sb/3465753/